MSFFSSPGDDNKVTHINLMPTFDETEPTKRCPITLKDAQTLIRCNDKGTEIISCTYEKTQAATAKVGNLCFYLATKYFPQATCLTTIREKQIMLN